MPLQLSATLLPRLREKFPNERMEQGPQSHILATFYSPSKEVGSLALQDDGDEITVFVADRTHFHFGCFDEGKTEQEQAEEIITQVLEFLRKVFADEIEFYGTGASGGCRERQAKPRGLLSRLFLGSRSYVWSGRLASNGDA